MVLNRLVALWAGDLIRPGLESFPEKPFPTADTDAPHSVYPGPGTLLRREMPGWCVM